MSICHVCLREFFFWRIQMRWPILAIFFSMYQNYSSIHTTGVSESVETPTSRQQRNGLEISGDAPSVGYLALCISLGARGASSGFFQWARERRTVNNCCQRNVKTERLKRKFRNVNLEPPCAHENISTRCANLDPLLKIWIWIITQGKAHASAVVKWNEKWAQRKWKLTSIFRWSLCWVNNYIKWKTNR